jgi:hypothetical protein
MGSGSVFLQKWRVGQFTSGLKPPFFWIFYLLQIKLSKLNNLKKKCSIQNKDLYLNKYKKITIKTGKTKFLKIKKIEKLKNLLIK